MIVGAWYFAGCASATAAFKFNGFNAVSYELKHNAILQNILGGQGFILAFCMLYRMKPTSLALFAPVCSSWTFMARHKTMRSAAFPLGFGGSCQMAFARRFPSKSFWTRFCSYIFAGTAA